MIKFPSPHDKILPHKIKFEFPRPEQLHDIAADRIVGSLIGLAVGDALGACVEFRPRDYLVTHPVRGMKGGGTWGLKAGQWTDDTSMALCLASSLLTHRAFNPYDQMVRYKWWYKHGYLSSTGHCFDIGSATRASLDEFYSRQTDLKKRLKLRTDSEVDNLPLPTIEKEKFDPNCSHKGVAGNGALMRLAPVPLFFYALPQAAVELSGRSARLTHGDDMAIDACRYFGALIVAAVHGEKKEELLSNDFYEKNKSWFGSQPLHPRIVSIAQGSYKQSKGYDDGIRGKGFVVDTLQAALWAFWKSESFNEGVLLAIDLGDDTDTTAAVFGQLAGAFYGVSAISETWRGQLYASKLITCIGQWLQVTGLQSTEKAREQRRATSQSAQVFEDDSSMETAYCASANRASADELEFQDIPESPATTKKTVVSTKQQEDMNAQAEENNSPKQKTKAESTGAT